MKREEAWRGLAPAEKPSPVGEGGPRQRWMRSYCLSPFSIMGNDQGGGSKPLPYEQRGTYDTKTAIQGRIFHYSFLLNGPSRTPVPTRHDYSLFIFHYSFLLIGTSTYAMETMRREQAPALRKSLPFHKRTVGDAAGKVIGKSEK